jgi:hypothetical protein
VNARPGRLRRLWSSLWGGGKEQAISRGALAQALARERITQEAREAPVAPADIKRRIETGGRFYRPQRFQP